MEFKATFGQEASVGQQTGFGEVVKSVTYMGKTYHYADKVMVVDENGVHSFVERSEIPDWDKIEKFGGIK